MVMPYIDADSPQVDFINTFGGYNHNNYISDGEFYDMQNMTCDDYPLASTRDKRGTHSLKMNGQDLDIIGMCGKDNINVLYKTTPLSYGTTVNGNYNAMSSVPFRKITSGNTTRYFCPCEISRQGSFASVYGRAFTKNDLNTYLYATIKNDSTRKCYVAHKLNENKRYVEEESSLTPNFSNTEEIGVNYGSFSNCHIVGFTLRNYITSNGCGRSYNYDTKRLTLSFNSIYFVSDFNEIIGDAIRDGLNIYITPFSYQQESSKTFGPYTVVSYSSPDMVLENTENSNFTLQELYEDEIGSQTTITPFIHICVGDTDVNYESRTGDTAEFTTFSVSGISEFPDLSSGSKFYIADQEVKFARKDVNSNTISIYQPSPQMSIGNGISTSGSRVKIASFNLATNTYSHITDVCHYQTGEHKVFEMGAYILLFPEKKQINTAKKSASAYTEIKDLEKVQSFINYRLCYQDGTDLTVGNTGASPSSTTDGYVWLDSSSTPRVLKIYNATLGSWSEIQPYIDFYTAPQTELVIDTYDSVDMDFGTYLETRIYREDGVHTYPVAEADLYRGNVSGYKNKSYIRIPVILNGIWNANNSSGSLQGSASKRIPKFDYLTVCNNRLWGCRFGENNYGDFVNEVFASKLGDAGNFNYLAGTSMDSFYMSMSDDGAFTGAYTYNSQPIFFRTDKIHRITGYLPENYQLITNDGYGCAKGSADSIVAMNNVIYYLSKVGVMAYGGDIPVSMSDAFGSVAYHNAISGTIGNKYYICMKDSSNVPTLFVYDDAKTMWHKEDNLDVKQFLQFENECYAWVGGNLIATGGLTGTKESNFPFMFQTGEIGYGTPYKKRLLKMTIRAKLPIGSRARIDIQYNGDGSWHRVTEIKSRNNVDSMAIPVSPYRCDHFSLRVVGEGEIKILSIAKFYTEGSDIQ